MKIGIIGLGVVGSAILKSFKNYSAVQITTYDIRDKTSNLINVIDTDCVFVCVPTNSKVDGSCDVTIVNSTIKELADNNYQGIIIIKSTVIPGTTEKLIQCYNLRIAFVPEFLRQDHADFDFISKKNALIVGTHSVRDYNIICQLHKDIITNFNQISPTEAELTKYFCNTFNSTRIVFANAFFEVCQKLNANYDNVLSSANLGPMYTYGDYLKCNNSLRGFGGACLPKDIKAFDKLINELDLPINIFKTVIEDNEYYKK